MCVRSMASPRSKASREPKMVHRTILLLTHDRIERAHPIRVHERSTGPFMLLTHTAPIAAHSIQVFITKNVKNTAALAEELSVGDIVEVKVLEVDPEKKRIALTMKGI